MIWKKQIEEHLRAALRYCFSSEVKYPTLDEQEFQEFLPSFLSSIRVFIRKAYLKGYSAGASDAAKDLSVDFNEDLSQVGGERAWLNYEKDFNV